MKTHILGITGACLLAMTCTSCMTTYDAYGRPVQSVDPALAVAGIAAAGIAGYALAESNDNNCRNDYYNNSYYGSHYYRPTYYNHYGYSRSYCPPPRRYYRHY